MSTAIEIARKYGYKVEPWDTFRADPELPEGLLARAMRVRQNVEAKGEAVTHVLYDPEDDDEGFLILGDNPELMSWELQDRDLPEFDEIEVPVELLAQRQGRGPRPSM